MNTVHVMSYIMWCDIIKYECDAFYRVYDIIHMVGLMSYIQRVSYCQTSGCDGTDTVAVMSYTKNMM